MILMVFFDSDSDSDDEILETELYDSGASCHMSPYRNRFQNFVSIAPKPISAANKVAFNAVGRGDVEIEVPCHEKTSKVTLKDVLYAPDMGLTLVSISRIAAAGFQSIFEGSSLKIRVEHNESAHAAVTTVTIDDLHRRMGHIAPDAAKLLVSKGIVSGLRLDGSQGTSTCDSCEFAKTTRKAIKRERIAERAKAFGDEIHSDLWGPAPSPDEGRGLRVV